VFGKGNKWIIAQNAEKFIGMLYLFLRQDPGGEIMITHLSMEPQ
jgi:hypothetical protein